MINHDLPYRPRLVRSKPLYDFPVSLSVSRLYHHPRKIREAEETGRDEADRSGACPHDRHFRPKKHRPKLFFCFSSMSMSMWHRCMRDCIAAFMCFNRYIKGKGLVYRCRKHHYKGLLTHTLPTSQQTMFSLKYHYQLPFQYQFARLKRLFRVARACRWWWWW